jgi:hypothetical protein
MMLRKGLILILVLALAFIPVLQAAHMLTHVDAVDATQVDQGQGASETDTDADRICLECLVLAAFNIIFFLRLIFLFDQMRRQPLLSSGYSPVSSNFSSPYRTRAPPRVVLLPLDRRSLIVRI